MLIDDIKKIDGFIEDNEIDYLYNLTEKLDKEADIIQIGTWIGKSAASIVLGMDRNEITGKFYIIDIFKNPYPIHDWNKPLRMRKDVEWKEEGLFERAVVNIRKFAGKASFEIVRDFSDDFSLFDIEKVSMVFIDGDHSAQTCLLDLLKYSQPLMKGGYIVCHDSCMDTIKNAIKIFLGLYPKDFEVVERIASLTIMRKL
jgi:predicted O-methyltransferase YrrM